MLAAIPFASCSPRSSESSAEPSIDTVVTTAALTSAPIQTQNLTLSIPIPATATATELALNANGYLAMGDRAQVVDASGKSAPVANVGTQESRMSMGVKVGKTWSKGNLFLAETALIEGDLAIEGQLQEQTGKHVTGNTLTGTVATQAMSRTVAFPTTLQTGINLEPGLSGTAAPGGYAYLNVKPRSTITLSAGEYFVDSLLIDDSATLKLDLTDGPIFLYVRYGLDFKGRVQVVGGAVDSFFLGYFGTQTVLFQGPMSGTVVAPNAHLTLGRTATPYMGSFFAKELEIQADAKVTFVPFGGWLIKKVTIDKTQACANEPIDVLVEVDASGAGGLVQPSINRMPGAHRILQFSGAPGPRFVMVTASSAKASSSQLRKVQVKNCGYVSNYPVLRFAASPYHANTADVMLTNAAELNLSSPSFAWSFGDGTTTTTTGGFVAHDYSAALNPDVEVSSFEVTLQITQPSGPTLTARTVVPVVNLYAVNRHRDLLLPPVSNATVMWKIGTNWTGTLNIKNLEATPLSFTQREVELRPCDTKQGPTVTPAEAIALTVAANGTATTTVAVPESIAGSQYCGMTVRLTGKSGDGKTAIAAGHFDTNERPYKPVKDASMGAALKKIVDEKLLSDLDNISEEDVRRLVAEGKITLDALPQSKYAPTDQVGERCYPGQVGRPGIECMAVDQGAYEDMFEAKDAFIENAVRGDVLLTHYCGDVGALLSVVEPAQYYTHSGIMIGHYEYVRHATAVASRIANTEGEIIAGKEGIVENVLRYGYPGSISETIEQGFRPRLWLDPEYGFSYSFHAFESDVSKCTADGLVVGPRVLKPMPGSGEAGRKPLRDAAQLADPDSYPFDDKIPPAHYRFFAYSRADMAADYRADGSASVWAQGSMGAMCSSYVWKAFKQAGVTLEGNQLESGDAVSGAQIRWNNGTTGEPDAPDGLYLYTPAERAKAADAIYTKCYNEAWDSMGFWEKVYLKIVEDLVANVCSQVVACFAQDACWKGSGEPYLLTRYFGATDGPTQWFAGPGITVSPDNLMAWDVLPYNEQMVYRPNKFRRIYRWKAQPNTGTVQVKVQYDNGTAAKGATVTLGGAQHEMDDNGTFLFEGIPLGFTPVRAWKMVDTHFLRTETEITVGVTNEPLVLIIRDNTRYRSVKVKVRALIHEDESPGCACKEDEVGIDDERTVHLNPGDTDKSYTLSNCAGDEVQGEVDIVLHLNDNGSVKWDTNLRLYEGTSCHDTLRSTLPYPTMTVAPGGTESLVDGSVRWGTPDNWDFMNVYEVTVTNAEETFPNPGPKEPDPNSGP